MEYVEAEEQKRHVKFWMKNFFLVFGSLFILLTFFVTVVVLFVSPFSSHLAWRQLQAEQDVNYILRVCDVPRPAADVGFGENDSCDKARTRTRYSPLKWAIIDTADDWNLCKTGGCAEFFFYIKLALGILFVLLVLIALKMSSLFAERAIRNCWQQESLPHLTSSCSSALAYGQTPQWSRMMMMKGDKKLD